MGDFLGFSNFKISEINHISPTAKNITLNGVLNTLCKNMVQEASLEIKNHLLVIENGELANEVPRGGQEGQIAACFRDLYPDHQIFCSKGGLYFFFASGPLKSLACPTGKSPPPHQKHVSTDEHRDGIKNDKIKPITQRKRNYVFATEFRQFHLFRTYRSYKQSYTLIVHIDTYRSYRLQHIETIANFLRVRFSLTFQIL